MTYITKLVYCIVIFGNKVKKGYGHSSLEHGRRVIVKSEKKVSQKIPKLVFIVVYW